MKFVRSAIQRRSTFSRLSRAARSAIAAGVAVVLLSLLSAGTAAASDPAGDHPPANSYIELDGDFEDWIGRANIVDPSGDAGMARGDIIAFYWANNPEDDTA